MSSSKSIRSVNGNAILSNDRSNVDLRRLLAGEAGVDLRDVGCFRITSDGSAPTLEDKRESYCFRTRGGRLIHHPSAYARKGRSNMVYHSAEWYTLTVGIHWLAAMLGKTVGSPGFNLVAQVEVLAAAAWRQAHPLVADLAAKRAAAKAWDTVIANTSVIPTDPAIVFTSEGGWGFANMPATH